MDVPDGLRERKKAATRAALAEAALRLAAEHGPDAVTTEAISEAAGVSPRTFFNHFASKEDAILDTDPHRADELAARLRARPPEESPLEALWASILGVSERLDAETEVWALRMQLVRQHEVLLLQYTARFAHLERVLVEALADRMGTDPEHDVEPWVVVAAALATLRVVSTRWRAAGGAAPVADLLAEGYATLASGLAAHRTAAAPATPTPASA